MSTAPGSRGARRVAAAAGVLALAGLLAACGSPGGSPGGSAVVPPAASDRGASPAPAGPLSAASPRPAGTAPAGGADVARDPSLLSILPPSVSGIEVAEEPDSFTEALGDPDFVASVDAAAFAIAVGPDDLASGVVAHLRPGTWSDAFFRSWRDSYDEGACAQAGGVVAHAETVLGGRTVFVTTCAGGLRTYHAYVEQRGVVISLFSLGEQRLGERLMADLRP